MTEKNHFVWVEYTVPNFQAEYKMAIDMPLTAEEAKAMCVILQAMRPNKLFVVSMSKPRVYMMSDYRG